MKRLSVSLALGLFILCGFALIASGQQTHTVLAENGGNTG